ncbi:sister chromatid cohesion protein PDS5 [Haloarchaeobius sp. DFWS5]|uniref:sister chromatid cohesion protein PDS5 n=1 Tax=Haloarchaeobius sp. DFWS5 TaxID=3446114 RepID=UPI003EC0E2A7
MDGSKQPPTVAHLTSVIEAGERSEAITCLAVVETAAPRRRKEAVQALRNLTDEQPEVVTPVLPALTPFLTDDERAVRLTTAKLFVAVAESHPEAVTSLAPVLADRLADDDEFYYVRARAAEALGYVARERPSAVDSPEVLADFRVGLSFDEPAVKVKLAKALECVALGNPRRLRHHVSTLAEHLDDDEELVRYHLCTALAAVGCDYPDVLSDASSALIARLSDESASVRGRAAEVLGLWLRAASETPPNVRSALTELATDDDAFVRHRASFARNLPVDETDAFAEVGTVDGLRATTEDAVTEITSPDGDAACPHCDLALPESGPPLCPRCGAPH